MARKKIENKEQSEEINVLNDKEELKTENSDKKIKSSYVKRTSKEERLIDIKEVDKEIDARIANVDNNENKSIKMNGENKKELFSLFEVILIVIITILSCILVGYFCSSIQKSDRNKDIHEISDNELKKFLEQYNYILDNYYGNLDKEKLINSAINGLFSSLDDHSQVIDQNSNTFDITLEGEYEGIGIGVTNDSKGNIIIQNIYKNTPAYKAGLKPNDIITKFNDISLDNTTTSKLVEMIASTEKMKLTILRDKEEFVVDLKREKIILESVSYKMLKDDIGYIQVEIFANNTKEQFEKALNDLENKKMKGLIIDLRDNTGGHLGTVEDMLSLFLDGSHIVYQTEDKNGVEKVYSKGSIDKNYKIVILQNSFSASASEIMTSALKEELGAYIIGRTSFGKGTVQTLKRIDSKLQYKVTTKRWLTPNGNWIDGKGIKPDLEIKLTEDYYENPIFENDNQLQAALDYLNS